MVVQNCWGSRGRGQAGNAGDTVVNSNLDLLGGLSLSLGVGRVQNLGALLVHHGRAVAGGLTDRTLTTVFLRRKTLSTGTNARGYIINSFDSSLLREYDSKNYQVPGV